MHGDLVVVELLPRNQWLAPSNVVVAEEEEDADSAAAAAGTAASESVTGVVPTGRVVGVLQRNWRSYVATIQLEQGGAGGRTVTEKLMAVPMDRRIPKVRVASRQASQLANARIVIRIDDWPINSKYAYATFFNFSS